MFNYNTLKKKAVQMEAMDFENDFDTYPPSTSASDDFVHSELIMAKLQKF